MQLNNHYNDVCVKVYDPNLKKVIGVYPSLMATANKLGLTPSVVRNVYIKKKRVYSPTYNGEITIRLSKKTKTEMSLIDKSRMNFINN